MRALRGVVLALTVAAMLGCAYTPTALPSASTSNSSTTTTAPAVTCANRLQSYAPPADGVSGISGAGITAIRQRGRLIAGVSADTYLFGARNPLTGRIEGFDIDIVQRIADGILGKGAKVELRVITSAQRLEVLKKHEVDVVVRTMTITCARWAEIAFSGEYFRAGQKLLVRRGLDVTGVADLAGHSVCAPRGTSSIDQIRKVAPEATIVPSDTHTGCLVLLQQGAVDVITGDDTVLAGLAAQDPYAQVVEMAAFTEEPYGVGVAADRVDVVRAVNAVLDEMKADGSWKASYTRWLAAPLGAAPTPPTAVYGRSS